MMNYRMAQLCLVCRRAYNRSWKQEKWEKDLYSEQIREIRRNPDVPGIDGKKRKRQADNEEKQFKASCTGLVLIISSDTKMTASRRTQFR